MLTAGGALGASPPRWCALPWRGRSSALCRPGPSACCRAESPPALGTPPAEQTRSAPASLSGSGSVATPPHPVSPLQGLGPEKTSTLHLARSWERFQCRNWAPRVPEVPSQPQDTFGCATRKHQEKTLCEESALPRATHGHGDPLPSLSLHRSPQSCLLSHSEFSPPHPAHFSAGVNKGSTHHTNQVMTSFPVCSCQKCLLVKEVPQPLLLPRTQGRTNASGELGAPGLPSRQTASQAGPRSAGRLVGLPREPTLGRTSPLPSLHPPPPGHHCCCFPGVLRPKDLCDQWLLPALPQAASTPRALQMSPVTAWPVLHPWKQGVGNGRARSLH